MIAAAWKMHGEAMLAGDPEAVTKYEEAVCAALDTYDDLLDLPAAIGEIVTDRPTPASSPTTKDPAQKSSSAPLPN
jgi:hypothetical protein